MSGGHSSRRRGKVESALALDDVRAEVGAEQIDYYRQRAPWFDDVYECAGDYDRGPVRNAEWRTHMAELAAAAQRAPLHGDCVELGIGTGYWTSGIIDRVDRLWGLDASPEMIDLAQRRFAGRDDIEFDVVDLWSWQPDRRWDCAVAFFFIEHVPDELLPTLLATLHGALRPGGCFFMAEGAWWQIEPHVETREIDGLTYRVVERRRSREELARVFEVAGFGVEIGTVGDYVHLTAVR